MSINSKIPVDAVNRQRVTMGGKAGQHSNFYDHPDHSTTRELSDVDNNKPSASSMAGTHFKHVTAPKYQR